MRYSYLKPPLPAGRRRGASSALLCLLLSACSPVLLALPEDRLRPIKIESDRAERDQKTGVTIYTGDVRIDQGTLHISADRVVITTESDEATEIVATGRPARMRQKPSLEDEVVHARGETIRYDVVAEILTLSTNASIKQGETSVNSDRIDYFLRERRYQAQGRDSREDGDNGRVRVVIPAKQVNEQIEKSTDGDAASPESGEEL